MPRTLFINLPVADLRRATTFYSDIGYAVNPRFTDETAACIVLDEGHLYLMLLTHAAFARFTSKPIADASSTSEMILSISTESRAGVDELAEKALASGGTSSADPQDLGFMYTRGFQDPDGHLWEILHLDLPAPPPPAT
jgi:predicted lactoylglutathione lyase